MPVAYAEIMDAPPDSTMDVAVLFTDAAGTQAALRSVGAFSAALDTGIRLVWLELVPLPLEMSQPVRPPEFITQTIGQVLDDAGVAVKGVEIYRCRDRREALRQIFRDPSLIVFSARSHGWLSKEHRLARWLRKRGHSVAVVDAGHRVQ